MYWYINFIILLIFASLVGCASNTELDSSPQKAVDHVVAPFAQSAIIIDISTDTDLNSLNGIANSCTILVIQAQKIATLNKLLSNPFELKSIFGSGGAQNEILKVDRYSAMPGQRTTLHIDRSQNTHYIAFVAGYYPFPKKQHMAIFAIPVTTKETGSWHSKWSAQLSSLKLRLRLGSDSISQLEGAKQVPVTYTDNNMTAEKGD